IPGGDVNAVSFYNVGNANFNGNLVDGNILGGVVLYGQIDNISITNNTIENYTSTVAGIRVINMLGYNSATADVTIAGNFINGSAGSTGIAVLDVPASDIVLLRNNSIVGNSTAIQFTGTGTLAASCNWFGTTNVSAIVALLSGNITFQPFLTSGVDDDPTAAGFQPSSAAQLGYVSAVAGNGQPISNGSTTYSAVNLTLMGSAPVGGYIVRNYSFTTAASCGGTSGATFTSLAFTGAGAARFSYSGLVTSTEYAPGVYNFSVTYTAHTVPIEDEVTFVMTTAAGEYTFKLKGVTILPEAPPVAEIRGNNVLIINGDFSPNSADHTDFGMITLPGTITRTFTVTNAGPVGCGLLSFTGGTPISPVGGQAIDFMVIDNTCTTPLASGASCTFAVRYTSGAGGVSNTMVRIANSDAARNPYEFAIRAELQTPLMSVSGNNTPIPNGDNTPMAADFTFMGSIPTGQTIDRSYTLKNLGLGGLQIGANAVTLSAAPAPQNAGSSNFTVVTQPTAGVYTTNQEAIFILRFTSPANPGSYYALVTLTTQNAGTITFVVQGNGPSPRMQVVGNNLDIPSGRTTVSTTDGTNFGARSLNTNTDRTFTIRNPGSLGAAAPLNLPGSPRITIGGANPTMFLVSIQPGSPISVNGSTTFMIRYRPTSAGCHYATISIPSNDPDPARSTYTFTVFGKSGASCPDNAPSPTDQEFSLADGFEVAISAGNEDIAATPRGLENIASEMALYPNPATDRIMMEVPMSEESQTLSFINARGVTVYSLNINGGLYDIDLTDFVPGVYMVVSSDRSLAPKRFIKL
ncbi:MAG: choice-of-anchor D domain-containing protein, partial [Saprospiraceae bacterium]